MFLHCLNDVIIDKYLGEGSNGTPTLREYVDDVITESHESWIIMKTFVEFFLKI